VPGVVPTGTIDQAERQAATWSYSGILAAEYVSPITVVRFTSEAMAMASFASEAMAMARFTNGAVALSEFDDENMEN
jgi:hypothetical protein